jgi:hypothetical protein
MTLAVIGLMLSLSVLPRAGGLARADDLPPGTVYVHFHGCPTQSSGGLNWSYDTLTSTCKEPAWYVTFSLTSEGQKYGSQWIGGDPRDQVFNNVPAHIFSLSGAIVPYDREPVVYCQGGDGSASGQYVQMEVHGDNNGYTVHPALGPIGYVVCDWFASAKDPGNEATASIAIDVHLCPAGYDLGSADHNALPAACKDTKGGIPFSVESNRNAAQKQATGDQVAGGVYYQYLLPDFVQITATEDGYLTPRVFCRGEMPGDDFPTSEIPANGGTFAYNLIDREHLICDWYIAPAAAGTISVNNHLCVGTGPDLHNADMNTLAQQCQQKMNGSGFTLKSQNENRQTTTGTDDDSAITWKEVAPGHLTIGQSPLAGFSAPRVFCSSLDDGKGGSTEYKELGVNGHAVDVSLEPGGSLACDWFNFPTSVDQSGALYVYTFACPDGFDATKATLKQTSTTCKDPQNEVGFQFVSSNKQTSGKTGQAQQGAIIWYGVPTNQGLTLVATPVAGFETAAVYCGQALAFDGQPSGYDRMDTYDTNTIYPAVVPGSQAICLWFSSPAGSTVKVNLGTPEAQVDDSGNGSNGTADQTDGGNDTNGSAQGENTGNATDGATGGDTGNATGGDNGGGDQGNATDQGNASGNSTDQSGNASGTGAVMVTVHICPVTFDANSASDGDLAGKCGGDGNGFDFTLTTEGQSYPQMTGQAGNGQAYWDNIPAHIFTIEESIPGGYDAPIVICDGQRLDASGGAIHPTVGEGATLSCDWYNVQA